MDNQKLLIIVFMYVFSIISALSCMEVSESFETNSYRDAQPVPQLQMVLPLSIGQQMRQKGIQPAVESFSLTNEQITHNRLDYEAVQPSALYKRVLHKASIMKEYIIMYQNYTRCLQNHIAHLQQKLQAEQARNVELERIVLSQSLPRPLTLYTREAKERKVKINEGNEQNNFSYYQVDNKGVLVPYE